MSYRVYVDRAARSRIELTPIDVGHSRSVNDPVGPMHTQCLDEGRTIG